MGVRLRYKVVVGISSTPAEELDLGNQRYEVVSDSESEGGIWKTTCAANTTMSIQLDNITSAKFLTMRFSSKDPTLKMTAVTVTLNGTAVLPPLAPVGTVQDEALLMLTTTGITSVTVANTQTGSVMLDVIIGTTGD